ncbi:unnamed protein product [Rotaria sp. Silwood1]|nr:unnamed protein product [Rotaria sp. Silwood1]
MFNDSLKPLLQLFARLAWYNIGYIDWESWLAQDYTKEAAEACQYLAMLRPESIVSPIVDKLLLSIDNLIEAHRFTSLMHCLKRMTRQLVRQTSSYFQGQTYILPLLMSVLPGIDLNDIEKTSMTLDFFDAIFMLISCVDCSSAVHTRNDLNEDSYEAIAKAIQNLLRSLLNIYPMNYRLTREQLDEPFIDFLPIRICVLSCEYYGVFSTDVSQMRNDVQLIRTLFRNEIIGERDNPCALIINQIELQIEEFELNNFRILTEIDKQIELKLFDLSINRYSEGCLYILFGNNHCFLPTKHSWTMMNKLWPLIVRRSYSKKISIERLIQDLKKQIEKQFVTIALIDNTNQTSEHAAIALWRPLEPNEIEIGIKIREKRHQTNIQSYNHLIDTLCSLLNDETSTWGQKKMAMSFLCLLLQKHVSIPSSCIETCLNFLIHDNIELRKHAVKAIAAFCRLQKLPRIYVEKSLDEILKFNDQLQPGDRDDNLWITYNNYKLPELQTEWEETCFLDKRHHGYYQWRKLIKYPINKRERYNPDRMPKHVSIIFDRFLDKNFIVKLTKVIIFDEREIEFNKLRFLMYKGLFRNFGLAFVDNFIEQLYLLIREKIQEKYEGSHRAASEIIAGIIRGSKYWTLEMLDELWQKLTPFLTEVSNNLNQESYLHWGSCFRYCLNDTDPRRMCRPINFIYKLIDQHSTAYTFNEASRWYLVQSLRVLQWRIPSIWCSIHEYAKELLDHSSKWIRERIAVILAMSFGLDLKLFDGKSARHPNTDQFSERIRERLRQAIDIYESKPLVNISGSSVELDVEARQALNLIETVIDLYSNLFIQSHQPIKEGIIRLFPYLCEIQSIVTNDDGFKKRLSIARMSIGMAYLDAHHLETLIQQLEYVCKTVKWHARQAAIEFIQNLVFCNLFNSRCHAKRLHELVRKCLFDEQLEVRLTASKTLSGFYQCGYISVTEDDLVGSIYFSC